LIDKLNYTNECEIRVVALVRSGHHAIINWITKHFENSVFLNNPDVGYDWFSKNIDKTKAKGLLIYNYERHLYTLKQICEGNSVEARDEAVGKSLRRYDCLVLRDPFNTFASKIRVTGAKPNSINGKDLNMCEIWKEHAREFLGKTDYLMEPKVFINYNKWFVDERYRRITMNLFGAKLTDDGKETVPNYGNGSSFDGLSFNGRASEMDVTNRWRHYADDDEFRQLFDAEMVELSERIFGHIEGTERLF